MNKLVYILLLTGFIACSGEIKEGELSRVDRLEIINELEDKALSNIEKFDTSAALALVNNYTLFASENPQDELTASFLFKAGDLCMAMHKPELAIQYMDDVINNHNDYERTPYCMFLKGFIYEDQLKDLEKAEESYKAFIKQYPDHEMTDAAKFSIKNLGKAPEE